MELKVGGRYRYRDDGIYGVLEITGMISAVDVNINFLDPYDGTEIFADKHWTTESGEWEYLEGQDRPI